MRIIFGMLRYPAVTLSKLPSHDAGFSLVACFELNVVITGRQNFDVTADFFATTILNFCINSPF